MGNRITRRTLVPVCPKCKQALRFESLQQCVDHGYGKGVEMECTKCSLLYFIQRTEKAVLLTKETKVSV